MDLDVWFARPEEKAYICVNSSGRSACDAGTYGDGGDCYQVWVKCSDLDLDWLLDLEDEDPKENTVLDSYTSGLDILDWFGWWGGLGEFGSAPL